jgi:hypothetical protein
MQIICTKAFQFIQHDIVENPTTKEKVAVIKQTHKITPSSNPQLVPDWIREDDLFAMGVADGSIKEVRFEIISEVPAKKNKEVKQMGWGGSASGLAK